MLKFFLIIYNHAMNKQIVYANGDSFVFGMEILGDDSRDPANKNLSFVKKIADSMGADYINNAYNSATNEFIFRKTLIDLEKLEQEGINPADVFVIVGWTALHREEIVGKYLLDYYHVGRSYKFKSDSQEYTDFGTFFISPSHSQKMRIVANGTVQTIDLVGPAAEFCSMCLWDDDFQQEKLETKILALQNYLEHKGYRYIFVNTCCTLGSNKLINFNSPNLFQFNKSFFDWGKEYYPDSLKLKNHFDETAHTEFAKLVIDHINQNSL